MLTELAPLRSLYRFHERYACALCEGVDPEIEARGAGPGVEHHPVWVIGHLTSGAAIIAGRIDASVEIPAVYDELFKRQGPSDRRTPEVDAQYPPLADVLAEYRRLHEIIETSMQSITQQQLETTIEWRLSEHLPTLVDLIGFMCVTHEAMHLGQLADWRRAMGLPGAMATM